MNPYLGQIAAFGGPYDPKGWLACDGRRLRINEYAALYSRIGDFAGGDTFLLPRLDDAVPGMRYLISFDGPWPREEDPPWIPDIMGFAIEWKGDPPEGTLHANGQIFNLLTHRALFSIIENRFGGDEKANTYALPNLGHRWIFCDSGSYPLRP